MVSWQRQPHGQFYRSVYQTQFYDWVTGVGSIPATFNNTNTYNNLSAWVRNSGSLLSVLGTDNETSYDHIGLANGTTAIAAAASKPLVNMQAEVKPNGASATSTGTSFLFRTRRHGSGAAWASATTDNGSLAAHYSALFMSSSDSTYSGYSSGHDQVALVGLAFAHAPSDDRGGTVMSTARVWGVYGEGVNWSTAGQGIGAEFKVVNNTGATALIYTNGGFANRNTAIQLTSAINEASASWIAGHGGSLYNSMYVRYSTAGVPNAACYTGHYYEAESIKSYIHDANYCTWNGTAVPFARLRMDMPILALAPDGTTDNLLFKMRTTGTIDYYLPSSSSTDNSLRWLLQSGTVLASINPQGVLDFTNTTSNTAPIITVTGTGTTAFAIAFTPGGTGQPSSNTISDWLAIRKNGVLKKIPCLPG